MPATSCISPNLKQTNRPPTRTSKAFSSKPRTSIRSVLTCRGPKVKISTWKPPPSLLPVHPQYLFVLEIIQPASRVLHSNCDCQLNGLWNHLHSPMFSCSLFHQPPHILLSHVGTVTWSPGRGNYVIHEVLATLQQCSSCFPSLLGRVLLGRAVVEIFQLRGVPKQVTWGKPGGHAPLEKRACRGSPMWLSAPNSFLLLGALAAGVHLPIPSSLLASLD